MAQKKTKPESRTAVDNLNADTLIMRFSALGDIAMTLMPVYEICRTNPTRRFILLTREHPATMFINHPDNLIIHAIRTEDFSGLSGLYRLFRQLKGNYNIDSVADLHDVLRTKIIRWLFCLEGVRVRHIDKGRSQRRRLTRPNAKHLVALTPMHTRYRTVLADAIGKTANLKSIFPYNPLFPSLPDPKIFSNASGIKNPGEKWIAIAPFARHEGKIYPPDLMQSVIDSLSDNDERKIFLFGFGPKENERIELWRAGRENIVNMADKRIGLPAELALLAHCDVMLTMDSANMHLARLVGLPTISIWGATHPYCGFLPEGTPDDDMIQLDMTCRPCSVFGQKPCRRGDLHCLRGITPARVTAAVNKKLSNGNR